MIATGTRVALVAFLVLVMGRAEELGRVSEGALADLLVLDADPRLGTRNLARIHRLVRDGQILDPATIFQKWPRLHCELVERMAVGSFVLDEERVTGMGDDVVRAIEIYEVKDGGIAKVRFLR